MSLKKYLALMTFSTLLAFGAWLLVLFLVDPSETNLVGFLIFYVSLLFALIGIFSIIGFVVRYVFKRDEYAFRQVKTSFRQAIMLSILLAGSLMLEAQNVLAWWNLLIFIAILTVLEFFFVNQRDADTVQNTPAQNS